VRRPEQQPTASAQNNPYPRHSGSKVCRHRHRPSKKIAETLSKRGKKMDWVATFLRKPHPYGMPGYPKSTTLARMLDDAASYFRTEVEPSRNVPGVLEFGRQSQPHMIFMSMVSNDLKRITGHWLDEEVGVLAEIAFDSRDIIDPEAVRWLRRRRKKGRPDSR
jgi:hypothetical protein